MSRNSLVKFAWLSILAAIATIALKAAAWWLTGSVGLLSDALESFVNLIAALVALGWTEQLETHIARGLGNGLSREEVAEIITHLSMYAGWPAAMTASHVGVDVFEAEDERKG